MSDEIKYKNNPLNGVSLKKLVTDLSSHYGFDILFAYLNINCFKTNPSVDASVKFLKKTEWARLKVETFYMYQYKSYPRVSSAQFKLPPRDRIVPDDQYAGEPAILSLEDADILREKRVAKAAEFNSGRGQGRGGNYSQRKTGGFKKKRDFEESEPARDSYPERDQERDQQSTYNAQDEDPWANWKK